MSSPPTGPATVVLRWCASLHHSRFNFQTASSFTHGFASSRLARGEIFVRAPSTGEGHGAPRGAVCIVSLPASLATRWSPEAHRLAGLHSRRFWARGPYFRMGRTNLIRSAFAAFIHIPCSRERQSHVVGPDGDPSLPDDMVANHARRRRILLRLMSALEKRPSRTGHADYIPRSRNVKIAVIPGRAVFARARNPRPLSRCSQYGFRACAERRIPE
jgi:hypothetical protein